MNCKEYKMMVSADLDGELTGDEKRMLAAHLSKCAECNKLLAMYKNQRNIFSANESAQSYLNDRVSVWDKVEGKLSQEERSEKKISQKVYQSIYYQLALSLTILINLIPDEISKTFAFVLFLYSTIHIYLYTHDFKERYGNLVT